MSEVFLCANGQLSTHSRSQLRKAGVIVVEVDDPSQCQFIRATELLSSDDMLWAALEDSPPQIRPKLETNAPMRLRRGVTDQ